MKLSTFNFLSGLIIALGLAGCATPRTKYTDPVLRVMVDAESIDKLNLPRVQRAIMESGKYKVVDRGDAYAALNKEADRQYKDSENRIEDKERYAVWGKQFGVGGIVVAKVQCGPSQRFMAAQGDHDCLETLQIIDAMTGEVIAMSEFLATDAVFFYGEIRQAPSWDDAVEKLNKNFPAHFENVTKTKTIMDREKEAEQKSKELREPAKTSEVKDGSNE